ncbi:hypothetical protein ACFLIN_05105 [Corynebacterium kutscheri]|uniref:hypothetical protein n=1 Tax=Corynebacterium kutscheri TaxID=35755 RepID=UPI001558E518|nr:hypothetical protein [Corynebacterium kutscheri]
MKIRKISLAIASAVMMAGSAAAIAPAQAFTPENLAENIQRNFSQYWDGGVQWCVGGTL